LKQVSGFKWDENGTDINNNTLPVWNTYVEMYALSTLHYFTHHNIYPGVPKGCVLSNKGLATLFQHANDDAIISIYRGTNVFHPLQDNPENRRKMRRLRGER
jgi:hypothetical protein